jgi:hypothetical protein
MQFMRCSNRLPFTSDLCFQPKNLNIAMRVLLLKYFAVSVKLYAASPPPTHPPTQLMFLSNTVSEESVRRSSSKPCEMILRAALEC